MLLRPFFLPHIQQAVTYCRACHTTERALNVHVAVDPTQCGVCDCLQKFICQVPLGASYDLSGVYFQGCIVEMVHRGYGFQQDHHLPSPSLYSFFFFQCQRVHFISVVQTVEKVRFLIDCQNNIMQVPKRRPLKELLFQGQILDDLS